MEIQSEHGAEKRGADSVQRRVRQCEAFYGGHIEGRFWKRRCPEYAEYLTPMGAHICKHHRAVMDKLYRLTSARCTPLPNEKVSDGR